jgi:general secretion pathway protein J
MARSHSTAASQRRRARAGVTMLEVIVVTAILAMIAVSLAGAFQHTALIRTRLGGRQERDHVARVAMSTLSRDLRGAFLSAHVNPMPNLVASITTFVGTHDTAGSRLDFTAFTHRRLMRDSHEGDACELGYRVEARRGADGHFDLVRRESPRIDIDPRRGGVVDVLVPDVSAFELRYYDSGSDTWIDTWDTTSATAQGGRLPTRVRITLTLVDVDGHDRRYVTETDLPIQDVLRFGLPIDYPN